MNFAVVLQSMGKLNKAKEMYQVVASGYTRQLGQDHLVQYNMACVESLLGHHDAALAMLRQAATELDNRTAAWEDDDLAPLRKARAADFAAAVGPQ